MKIARRTTRTTRTSALVAATVAGGVVLSLVPAAFAAPGNIEATTVTLTNNASWSMRQYGTGSMRGIPAGDPSVVIDEGSFGMRSDAFDGAFAIQVGGARFAAPGGMVNYTDERMSVAASNLRGLDTSATYRAIPGTSTLQVLVKLENPSDSRIVRQVAVNTNLGSDSSTTIERTSDGNRTFGDADRWLITSDQAVTAPRRGGPGLPDPVVAQVFSGKGAGDVRTVSSAATGSDQVDVTMKVAVPAGETRFVLLYTSIRNTVEAVTKEIAGVNEKGLTPKLLTGIGEGQQSRIVNWDL